MVSEICEVCELTCCDMGLLRAGSSENVITELSAYEASNARDTLCKALYSRLFTWLVNAINESTKVKLFIQLGIKILHNLVTYYG